MDSSRLNLVWLRKVDSDLSDVSSDLARSSHFQLSLSSSYSFLINFASSVVHFLRSGHCLLIHVLLPVFVSPRLGGEILSRVELLRILKYSNSKLVAEN